MGPLHLQVKYRPFRVGWCIDHDDLDGLRTALRYTHTLWGGRFNPVIPLADVELARRLIRLFQVDCLYCPTKSTAATALMGEFSHLFWPTVSEEIFSVGPNWAVSTLLDVSHPLQNLYDANIRNRENPATLAELPKWEATDPLSDVFLVTFGAYPPRAVTGVDYESWFRNSLFAQNVLIQKEDVVPPTRMGLLTPSGLTAIDLRVANVLRGWANPGLYYGDCSDFTDLINFWNIRASGIDVLFFDPAFDKRLAAMNNDHLAKLRARRPSPTGWIERISLWTATRETVIDLARFDPDFTRNGLSSEVWNGLNIRPLVVAFKEHSVLGIVTDCERMSVTFELPEKPFSDEPEFAGQKAVVSVYPLISRDNQVFKPPFFPKLNEYYGREAFFEFDAVRSQPDGLGICVDITNTSLTIHALDVRTLVTKVFGMCGIGARPSNAGLISLRLIQQMGGLEGCRVFKIVGIRELIRRYSPDQSFTKSGAVEVIRQAGVGESGFATYESMYLGFGDRQVLKPQDAFYYLLKKGVFRTGLRLKCPVCELEYWIYIDDARTMSTCEYCGTNFYITPQLRDRDWAYRRSGLFGRNDDQGGGIPVALTVHQLYTALRGKVLAFTTGTELEPSGASILKCETDLVMIVESRPDQRPQIVIGECKSHGTISAEDTINLGRVADVLDATGDCDTYIVFSKTGIFSMDEIELCKGAQGKSRRRVILLSARELESQRIYESAERDFEVKRFVSSLEDMAEATMNIYFDPKRKKTS